MERYKAEAKLFKALNHPARLAILEVLREDEHCVCHLEACLGYRQAYISQQLSVLRDAGLVLDRRNGWNIYYRVVRPEIYNLVDEAVKLAEAEPAAGVTRRKSGNKPCPCPKCNQPGNS